MSTSLLPSDTFQLGTVVYYSDGGLRIFGFHILFFCFHWSRIQIHYGTATNCSLLSVGLFGLPCFWILFYDNTVFQVQDGVFLFFCRYEAEIFLWLLWDYREEYAHFFTMIDVIAFYRFSTFIKSVLTKISASGTCLTYFYWEIRKFQPQYTYKIYYKKKLPWSQRFFLIFPAWESGEAANASCEAARKKKLLLPWTWISLSCRRQGQDLTLGLGLVDIFTNTQINMIGLFDW